MRLEQVQPKEERTFRRRVEQLGRDVLQRGQQFLIGKLVPSRDLTNYWLANRQAFALAGVPDPARFDHQLVGFDMQGRHLELGCVECHGPHAPEPPTVPSTCST